MEPTTRRSLLVLGLAGVLLSGLLCVWIRHPASAGPWRQEPASPESSRVPSELPRLREPASAGPVAWDLYGAAPGTVLRYRLDYASTVTATPKQGGAGQKIAHRVQGMLVLSVLARDAASTIVRLALPGVAVEVDLPFGAVSSETGSCLAADLARGADLRLARDGEFLGYRFPEGVQPASRNLLRAITHELRCVVAGDDQAAWQRVELGLESNVRVAYRWARPPLGVGECTEAELERERRGGMARPEPAGKDGTERPVQDVRGSALVRFARSHGFWTSVEARTSTRVEAGLLLLDQHAELHLGLAEVGSTDLAVTASSQSEGWAPVDGRADALVAEEIEAAAQWEVRLASRSVAELVDALVERCVRTKGFSRELLTAFQELTWKLRLDSRTLESLRNRVLDPALAARARGLLLDCVGVAGSPACQDLLATLARDCALPLAMRSAAVHAAFSVRAPAEGYVAALTELSQREHEPAELCETVWLALGTAVRRCERAADGRQALLGLEAQAQRRGMTITWLEALGNLGHEAALPIAARYLQCQEPALREAGASALRKIATTEAEQLLAECARSDSVAGVRARAGEILAARGGPGSLATVTALLASETVEDVRLALVQALAKCVTGRADACELLERQARQDAAPRVREAAQAALNRLRKAS